MTQSDSPDFEFDISDLEVDGVDAATSRDGEVASSGPPAGKSENGSQVFGSEKEANDVGSSSEAVDDEALGGFAIDEIPDAFSGPPASGSESPGPTSGDAAESNTEVDSAGDASQSEDSSGRVSRIDEEARSLRELGDDDLGADVFSEVDEAEGSDSFADVIDDLMEEVETYEAGGFVDLEEEASTAEAEQSSEYFKMEDPDDSLGKSVDPGSGPEADAAPVPSFPSPPMDFEIPADPELESETPVEDDAAAPSEPELASESKGPADAPEEWEIPAEEPVSKASDAEASAADEIEETVSSESKEEESPLPAAPADSDPAKEVAQAEEGTGLESAETEGESSVSPTDADTVEEVPEAESSAEAEQAGSEGMPSAEDLLKRAGSLLNKDGGEPSEDASAVLDEIEDAAEADEELNEAGEGGDEGVVAMPTPTEMMADAVVDSAEADEDDGVFTLPDPLEAMGQPSESDADAEGDVEMPAAAVEREVASPSGNVADRGGDLPPPPPAPVEIIDEEPPEEDEAAPEPEIEESAAEEAAPPDDAGDDAFRDPFASEISLDDFNDSLSELDGLDEAEVEEADMFGASQDAWASGSAMVSGWSGTARSAELSKPTLLWRLAHSMAIAAGIVLIGASILLYTWKQEIMEHFEGRDLDGSALITQIRKLGGHALVDFNEDGLYRMQWMDSEVRRVTDNEIRIHALIGAQLRQNLYTPVLESDLKDRFGRTEDELLSALSLAHSSFPEEIGNYPEKPWDVLYRLSAAREDTLPLRVTYGLTRANRDSDWELSRVKVSGRGSELVWHEGNPRHSYGENAYDVDSREFAAALRSYRSEADRYVAQISQLEQEQDERLASAQRENEQRREQVADSLTQGAFFSGLAILGEDAAASRDVRLVITESRDRGAFVKGVFKTGQEDGSAVKHFVGSLAFEDSPRGQPQGVLKVTTVAIDAAGSQEAEPNFFDPNTVTRIRLLTDGFQLEGDTRGFSLRLTRNQ